MEKSARLAGYTLAFLALAGLMVVVAFLQDGNLFLRSTLQVSFPTMGSLMEDDPVRLRGVEIGRVDRIERGPDGPVVTLELYKRMKLPRDSRFVNFNYSLFGARMVVLVPGKSPDPMDYDVVQAGHFTTGVAETIHRVDQLLRTVVEYQGLAARLDKGNDTALSFQQILSTQVYPALDEFGIFAKRLEDLEQRASSDLEVLARASSQVHRYSTIMSAGTDTLVTKAQLTLERLATLTAQTTLILNGLEKIMLASQDTSVLAGKILAQRDLYERSLILAHVLHDLLQEVKTRGLKDIIHFWRNVHFGRSRPKP